MQRPGGRRDIASLFQNWCLVINGQDSYYSIYIWTSRTHPILFYLWQDPIDPRGHLKRKHSQRETELRCKPSWLLSRYVQFGSKLSVQGRQNNDSVQTLNTQPVSTCPCHSADIYILHCTPWLRLMEKTLGHSFLSKIVPLQMLVTQWLSKGSFMPL